MVPSNFRRLSRTLPNAANAIVSVHFSLWFSALVLIFVTVASALSRSWWFFDLFTHFRVQYVATAALLCLGALVLRSYISALIFLMFTIIHGWSILPFYLSPVSESLLGTPFRLVAANVNDDHPHPQNALDLLSRMEADLLVLTEVHGARWGPVLGRIAPQYPYRVPDDWHRGSPIVLLSKHPLEFVETAQDRSRLMARVSLCGGLVTVIGVNLAAPSLTAAGRSIKRNQELRNLESVIRRVIGPVIVAGDFNVSPFSPHFYDLMQGTKVRNTASGHGIVATWPTWSWPMQVPIDHVLARGQIAAVKFARGPDIGSDHYPIIADLSIGECDWTATSHPHPLGVVHMNWRFDPGGGAAGLRIQVDGDDLILAAPLLGEG